MINTYSKFIYGYTVTSDNKWIDISEDGVTSYPIEIPTGYYSPIQLAAVIELTLNDSEFLSEDYTVTFNASTRYFTITTSGTMWIYTDTGVNADEGIYDVIGLDTTSDYTSETTITSSATTGTVYLPQFKLQKYTAQEDAQSLRLKAKSESASGVVNVISFGTDKMVRFNIMFCTDIPQPASGPIVSNTSGVADCRAFLQFLMNQGIVLFLPNKDDSSTYYQLILKSSSTDSDGTGYELTEQYEKGLVGYYETGLLTFRVIEE